jgi:hypothetical protein
MPEVTATPVTPGIIETPVEEVKKDEPAAVAEEPKTDDAVIEEPADAETTEQQEAKKQSKFQRRLERQKTARIEAETESRLLRERIAVLEAQGKPIQGNDEPQRDDFEDYESYLRAITKYDAKQVAAEALKTEREQAQGREKQSASQEKTAKAWVEREKAFQGVTKDYDDVVAPFVEEDLGSLSANARSLIVDSEVGPQLLYHLANHPEVMDRIADLSSVRQIAELGKLEDKLSTPAKKTTSAPAPANHVNTGKTGQKDPAKMDQTEYRAWMKANGSRFV